ncbi:hypothetical protein L1049_006152 [Liquidambar formosana]|uniref:Myb-like domain-containing protein n=1 Tax=Liquidambar formosana TaxID=63359 RepID=A0AAP0RHK5_LIQFO
MGFKRPFDDEESQELPFKHLRQLDYSNKPTSFAEIVPHNDAPQKPDISDEGSFHKSQRGEGHECDAVTEVSIMADKDFETSGPLSGVTGSTSEDDAGSGAMADSSLYPEHFESDFPRRKLVQFEDIYSSLLDCSPRKQVPVGPNYQANVPVWGLQENKNILDCLDTFNSHISSSQSLGSDCILYNDDAEKLMGTCIIPMPNSELSALKAGEGRMDCGCLDRGSVRCVQQHVMEAREKLRKTLGQKKFVDLGFYDMGEVVAHKWSEEEEDIFHKVVFSNPASLRKNFWEHLAVMFPSRSKRELVSYYFNVFMLRRRAAQNRCNLLDIDSDDDEWQGSNADFYIVVKEEDNDSLIESLLDQDNQVDYEGDSSSSDDDDDDDDDDDGDADESDRGDNTVKDGERDHTSEANFGKLRNGCRFVSVVHHADEIFGSIGEDFDIQDDSCMSFEGQPNMPDSGDPVEAGAAMQESRVESDHSECLHANSDGCDRSSNGVAPGYLFDPCDTKVWDNRYLAGLDLLPTCSMIEELFGPGELE